MRNIIFFDSHYTFREAVLKRQQHTKTISDSNALIFDLNKTSKWYFDMSNCTSTGIVPNYIYVKPHELLFVWAQLCAISICGFSSHICTYFSGEEWRIKITRRLNKLVQRKCQRRARRYTDRQTQTGWNICECTQFDVSLAQVWERTGG